MGMEVQEDIHRIQAGHEEGFSLLVNKHTGGVFRIAMGFVHNKQDAEDITQDVFVKAWEGLSGFDERSSFTTWLYRITINESLNYLKKKKRRQTWEKLKNIFSGEDTGREDPDLMGEKEEQLFIKATLDTLSDKQKQAFVLCEYEEMPQREIAAVMGITEGAVEQLLFRARASLKKRLEKSPPHP